jgi:hypothetical protein
LFCFPGKLEYRRIAMDEEHSASQVSWGARINTCERYDATDCPDWANPADRERWTQKGLIIWQKETRHVIRLSATHAMQLLDGLRSDDACTEKGITIGEPVARISVEGLDRKPRPGLWNPIHLSPRQTKVLIRLLERNLGRLEDMREQEDKERDRARDELARILAKMYLRFRAKQARTEDSSTD